MTRKLTHAAQVQHEAWKDLKCTNPNAIVCYCPKCQHPGHPERQKLNDACWENDGKPELPPRGRMRDWVQSYDGGDWIKV